MTPKDLRVLRGLLRDHGIEDGLTTAWRLWLDHMGQRPLPGGRVSSPTQTETGPQS